MTKKITDNSPEEELDASIGGARPVRLRRVAKATVSATARSRKSRRKATNVPGGIHRRANKRMSW